MDKLTREPWNSFSVIVPLFDGTTMITYVNADKLEIADGCLIFSNVYSRTWKPVASYAPGGWREVHKVEG